MLLKTLKIDWSAELKANKNDNSSSLESRIFQFNSNLT